MRPGTLARHRFWHRQIPYPLCDATAPLARSIENSLADTSTLQLTTASSDSSVACCCSAGTTSARSFAFGARKTSIHPAFDRAHRLLGYAQGGEALLPQPFSWRHEMANNGHFRRQSRALTGNEYLKANTTWGPTGTGFSGTTGNSWSGTTGTSWS